MQSGGKEKALSLVDLAYRRAKAAKAAKKAMDVGKIIRKGTTKKMKQPTEITQSRREEMQDLFQSDMSERKLKKKSGMGGKKKSKFKSKSR